jgi:predicted LPLAT superfamily acyltransferase
MVMFQDATGEQNHAPLAAQRGVELISSDGSPASAAAILAALREGCLVGMMADRVLTGAGIEMEFLGAPAAFPASPFAIAAAAGAPVVFCFAVRTGPSRYRFEGRSPEAQVPDRPIRRSERHIYWTRQFAQALEQLVREHPEQWGNFYSFWKTGGSPR